MTTQSPGRPSGHAPFLGAMPAIPSTSATAAPISAEALFRLHAPFVARFLMRIGVPRDAIDDAVQEVFLVVHRHGGYRPGAARPTSYLAKLALHAASAHRRRERRRCSRQSDAPVDDVAATDGSPVEHLESHESLLLVERLLARLEPDLRTTLVLAELEGESCGAIAATMGIPVGTVYWRLHQARKKFQKALQSVDAATVAFAPAWTPEVQAWLHRAAQHDALRYAIDDAMTRHHRLAASSAPAPSWAGVATGGGVAGGPLVTALAIAAAAGIAAVVWTSAASPPSMRATALAASPRIVPPVPAGAAVVSAWTPVAPAEPARPADVVSVPVDALPRTEPVPAEPSRRSALRVARAPDEAPDLTALTTATSATPTTAVTPTSDAPATPDAMLELRGVAEAERALATDPAGALARVRALDARAPHGYLDEERRYVAIAALVKLGRLDEARALADAFLGAYPDGAFARRVREATRPRPGHG
jgi:RNA polymerase sigma-70 factor (ECF subfamily)